MAALISRHLLWPITNFGAESYQLCDTKFGQRLYCCINCEKDGTRPEEPLESLPLATNNNLFG